MFFIFMRIRNIGCFWLVLLIWVLSVCREVLLLGGKKTFGFWWTVESCETQNNCGLWLLLLLDLLEFLEIVELIDGSKYTACYELPIHRTLLNSTLFIIWFYLTYLKMSWSPSKFKRYVHVYTNMYIYIYNIHSFSVD